MEETGAIDAPGTLLDGPTPGQDPIHEHDRQPLHGVDTLKWSFASRRFIALFRSI